ncbi:MAG: triose-phosphate isomerase [Phycisphaeraceae bacterium]|nr:triose-phosphate isomerase [Phycisphaeraceae bacterium]
MNLHTSEAHALARAVANSCNTPAVDVAVFPAFPYLVEVSTVLQGQPNPGVLLGAQDFYPAANGAFTGEVSLSMLQDHGVAAVLVGHSERRHIIGEPETLINDKVQAGLEAGMEVILCIGEKLEQREAGKTDAINAAQLAYGLAGVKPEQMARLTVAYEPVWAIGTGKTATPQDAQAAHAACREVIASLFNGKIAQSTRIQYGGSVKGSNAAELFAQPDIDGGLIGGASLKSDEFLTIVQAAAARSEKG